MFGRESVLRVLSQPVEQDPGTGLLLDRVACEECNQVVDRNLIKLQMRSLTQWVQIGATELIDRLPYLIPPPLLRHSNHRRFNCRCTSSTMSAGVTMRVYFVPLAAHCCDTFCPAATLSTITMSRWLWSV